MMSVEAYSLAQFREEVLGRKLDAFVEDYSLGPKPALVFQSMPLEAIGIDVSNDAIRTSIQEGAGAISDTAWWCAFKAGGRSVLVFDGLASSSEADEQGWASEVHVDGHFLAGLWTFPDFHEHGQASRPAVASFFVDAFRDFGFVARKVYEAASYSGSVAVTCTMLQANQLPLAAPRGNAITSAVKRSVLRWPPQTADGPADIDAACAVMAVRFMRTYGKKAELW
jgi:hypothetical protein